MWGGLPCIYMRILWKEVFNPIHFKTLFVYPTMLLETIRCILFKSLKEPLLEILLIARNVLIIITNWNGKMTKETN